MLRFIVLMIFSLALMNNVQAENRNIIMYTNLPIPPNVSLSAIGTVGVVYVKNNCFYLKNSFNKSYLIIWPFGTLYNKNYIKLRKRNGTYYRSIPLNTRVILGGRGFVADAGHAKKYRQCIGKDRLIINAY